jgi:type IV pilus assembly protein PilC
MPIFRYKAIGKDKRTINGFVDAVNEATAMETLEEKGMTILNLSEEGRGLNFSVAAVLNKIKVKDIVIFARQFSVLVSANVTLVQSLKILTEQVENVNLRKVVAEVAEEIDGGARLSDSLAKRPEVFSNFFVNVIRSGETSGKLDEVLNYLADELEKDYDMLSKIKGAMIYPVFITVGLIGVGIFMMISVVPKLTAVIIESGGKLPFATRVLVALSAFLTKAWPFLIILAIGGFFGIRYFKKTPMGKMLLDSWLLKLPVFGLLFQRIYLVRFTRSLQTLIIGGVNISKALSISSEVVSNQVYKNLIEETIKEVEDGNSITSVFENSKQIPKMVSQMMSIGEKSGRLDSVLGRITDFYGREINNIIANLMSLMEPIIMVVMGAGVGLMVAAVILPMYQMASSF